jgi:hypothetical protein
MELLLEVERPTESEFLTNQPVVSGNPRSLLTFNAAELSGTPSEAARGMSSTSPPAISFKSATSTGIAALNARTSGSTALGQG